MLTKQLDKKTFYQENLSEQQKRILSVSAKLFRNKGFSNTSVDEIAFHLGMNKAMLYYYFKSKGFLLYAILVSSIDERIKEAELLITDGTAPEKMRKLISRIIEMHTGPVSLGGSAQFELRNLPPSLRKSYIAKRDKYEQIVRSILREGVETGYFRKEIDPCMTSRLILGVLNSMAAWYREDGFFSTEEVIDRVWEFIRHAIE
jgi:AcrR family transcriptional regulator